MTHHPNPETCSVDFTSNGPCPGCRRELADRAMRHEVTILVSDASFETLQAAFHHLIDHIDAAAARDALLAVTR